jgi:phosphatidate cytidylyltransferase
VSNLGLRALTGSVYVAVTLGAAWAGPFTTMLLFLPVGVVAASELHRLLWPGNDGPPMFWTMLLAGAVQLIVAMGAFDTGWTADYAVTMVFILLLISIAWMLFRGTTQPAYEAGGLLLTILYIGLPCGVVPHFFVHGPWLFVGFMLMLWTNDTGAYLVGRTMGRTKLLPAVSPNKTMEGFLGGVLLTLGVAYLLSRFHDFLPVQRWILLGAVVSATSTLGDLLESAFKRASGVKDSGTILPGHGGVLDRFDGFLLAAPSLAIYLWLAR